MDKRRAYRYSLGMTAINAEVSPSRRVAAEIRAEMARRGLSSRRLAIQIGVSNMWVSRRVGIHSDVELTLEDVDRIATALGVDPGKIVRDSMWLPRLDSNQQPFGYSPMDATLFEFVA